MHEPTMHKRTIHETTRNRGIAFFVVLSLCSVVGVTSGYASRPVTIVKRYTQADREAGRYQYVPFEVPRGTGSLRVIYSYDRADGNNVIDLGLFEPGSLELGTGAFRGYSGGAKSEVVISAGETTRGYRPGPIPAGTWHVMLGLYKVADNGAPVTITVEATPGPPPPAPPPAKAPAGIAGTGPQWYTGALHTHTLHSDGRVEPRDLLGRFGAAGFDFVFITDHNNTTHRWELGPELASGARPLWMVGEEVTTPAGHASVWGLDPGEWVDFRVSAEDRRIGELIAAAHRQGALFSVNHPVSSCAGCSWEHSFAGIDGMEIWNGGHTAPAEVLDLWDRQLRTGHRVTAVGASDWHRDPDPMDVASVRVFAQSLAPAAILDALRAGRVIVTRDAQIETPDVIVRAGTASARVGDSLRGGGPVRIEVAAPSLAGGTVRVVSNGEPAATSAIAGDGTGTVSGEFRGYVRLELFAADGTAAAFTNPVYLSGK